MYKNFMKKVVFPALIGCLIAFILKIFIFQVYTVRGESMLPTFQDGNVLIGFKFNAIINNYDRSDILIVENHHDEYNDLYIKRLIAIEGDKLEFKNNENFNTSIYLNGELLEENYINEDFYHIDEVIEVPENKIFVMGDNRNNSSDSRNLGFFDESDIVSTADIIIKK